MYLRQKQEVVQVKSDQSTIMSNKAAWITKPKGNPLEVKEAPMPKAAKGEIVIKNHAVAVNPVDCECQFSLHILFTNIGQGKSKTTASSSRNTPISVAPTSPARSTKSAKA